MAVALQQSGQNLYRLVAEDIDNLFQPLGDVVGQMVWRLGGPICVDQVALTLVQILPGRSYLLTVSESSEAILNPTTRKENTENADDCGSDASAEEALQGGGNIVEAFLHVLAPGDLALHNPAAQFLHGGFKTVHVVDHDKALHANPALYQNHQVFGPGCRFLVVVA